MAIALGNITISNVAVGSSAAAALALGNTTVWQLSPEPAAAPWLCFTAAQDNSSVRLSKSGSPSEVSLETSTDGETWTDYTINSTLSLANTDDKVYFRAKNENLTFSSIYDGYYYFEMEGIIAASGNLQSLLKADCTRTDVPNGCYYYLFAACASLTTAPALPATTLADNCYQNMFYYCTSLTQAPALPATTLADNCYTGMFSDCLKLASIEVQFSAWSPASATSEWLYDAGMQATGTKTFICPSALGTDSTITRGTSNCPAGWTVVNT